MLCRHILINAAKGMKKEINYVVKADPRTYKIFYLALVNSLFIRQYFSQEFECIINMKTIKSIIFPLWERMEQESQNLLMRF